MLLRHEFETRSLPCSLAAALAALPSISLIPSARFTNSHQLMRFMRRCFRAQRLFWARWSLNPAGAEKLLGKISPTCRAVQRGAGPAKFVRIRAIRVYLSETLSACRNCLGLVAYEEPMDMP